MRFVFFGSGAFAIPALRAIAKSTLLVVSQPDRPAGRGMQPRPSPLKVEAARLGIEVETPHKCRAPEFIERVRSLDADALIVASYGQILPEALLSAARQGAVNLHASVLPKWRGAAPIQRAILAGDVATGVTLMRMDAGLDTGPIVAVAECPIGPDETAAELESRLAALGAGLLAEWAPRIAGGDLPCVPQDDSKATLAPKVAKAEGELSVLRDADFEYRRFRAFAESPGAILATRFGKLKLNQVAIGEGNGEPGTVLSRFPDLVVAFRSGSLVLRQVTPEGKKRMSGSEFANGARLRVGANLIYGDSSKT